MKTTLRFLMVILCSVLPFGVHAQDAHWSVNIYDYQYDMTAYVALNIDGVEVSDYSDYDVAAFCGDECRGVVTVRTYEKNSQQVPYGYLRIRSNQASGESITFKVYQKSVAKEMNVYMEPIAFQSQQVIGMPSSPLTLPVVHYTVSVSCDGTMGEVSGGGLYDAGSQVTVTATPKEGYHFVKWSDESVDNPYSFAATKDVELTAQFAPNPYTMTFVLDNGEENIVITKNFATELTAPADPTKTGFTFAGWSPAVPDSIPAADMTFTAQWTRNSYKLKWVVDNEVTESDVLFEDPIVAPADPVKEGYTFTGWTPAVAQTMPAEDVTYTAQFQINQYTMTFVLDNGEENIVITKNYATELTAPADPTRTGFTFTGWSPAVPDSIPAADMTFTAQWTRNSYKLKWVVDNNVTESDVLFEDPIVAPADPVKEGYTFTGWTPAVAQTMPAEDVTYTAQFQINQYTMTFVLDNGEADIVVTKNYATELTAPADPTKTGFTFAGWSPAVPDSIPAADMTFTAQWTRNSYKLKWVVDNNVTESDVLFEDPIVAPADPVKEGYTFTGWTPAVAQTMPAEDVTYTAQFQINQYTMTFVLDNGEADIVVQQDYATELTAPADPTKTGFTFAGWSPVVPATIPAADMTFTAQWTRNSYKLKWLVDNNVTESDVLFEDPIVAPADPVKEGYTFTGWTPAVAQTMPAEDVTYTAQFQINQYTMTFVLDNGEENIVITQDYATELTAPDAPTKTGFTFAGWSPAVPATIPAADMIFTAQWTRNSYKLKWVVDNEVTESDVLFEDPIVAPADPVKEGYTFTGWTPAVAQTMPAEDVTYTAQFQINQYTMTFVLDNGEADIVVQQNYATELTAPADPTKTGFTFTGWSPVVPATIPAADMTFTAQWTRNSYKLKWVVDNEVTESDVLFEDPIVAPADPVKEGYTFTGWTPAVAQTMPAEDVTYTAQFTVNTYAVIYMVNGVEWQRDLVDYGQPIVLRDYTPAEGYRFEGWTSDADYETMPAHDVVYTAVITLDRIKGDVNGDGAVDIADVVAVYNIMAGKNTNGFNGDVNEDGAVDIADVVAIYNIMAGKQ